MMYISLTMKMMRGENAKLFIDWKLILAPHYAENGKPFFYRANFPGIKRKERGGGIRGLTRQIQILIE